jgi:hypothetical protein
MKIWSLPCIFCWFALLLAGCDETIAPKEEFQEQYVLYAFVQGGDNHVPMTMNVLIARTYDVQGFDPSTNTTDPAIDGAVVVIRTITSADTLKECFRVTKDSLRYGSVQRYYSGTIRTPLPGDAVSLSARLTNGKVLTSQTIIPYPQLLLPSYEFPRESITRAHIPDYVHRWTVNWLGDVSSLGHLFFPRLKILYSRRTGTVEVSDSAFVPMTFVNGKAIYPASTFETSCSFDFAAIDTALAHISAGDPQKMNYHVHGALFELLEYDDHLTKYYSSINGAIDPFSIRITSPIYSNIAGGIGMFGSSLNNTRSYTLDSASFAPSGYR